MDKIERDLATRILATSLQQLPGRTLVGIAGPPGCGKSTIATHVVRLLNERDTDHHEQDRPIPQACVVGMDGFHYTRAQLDALPNAREAHARRGAPWTFAVERILHFLDELCRSARLPAGSRPTIHAPSFDHAVKDPVEHDIRVPPAADIVILEGNYLFLDQAKWRDIASRLHLRVFVDVAPALARERVARRHLQSGIETTLDQARRRFDENDAPNGELVRACVGRYDVLVQSVEE